MGSDLWKKNIVLVGFMGVGKTTIAKSLAARKSLHVVDTDARIAKTFDCTISDIFSRYGEEHFRKAETDVLKSLQNERGLVIATGGGIVLKEENWALMRNLGPIVHLDVSQDVLKRRLLGETGRPLADSQNWTDILNRYKARQPLYSQADVGISVVDEDPEEIVDILLRNLQIKNRSWKF